MTTLTANDPEPEQGSVVRDALGMRWLRHDGMYGGPGQANWVPYDSDIAYDVETWRKIAGNYGPVTVLSEAEAP